MGEIGFCGFLSAKHDTVALVDGCQRAIDRPDDGGGKKNEPCEDDKEVIVVDFAETAHAHIDAKGQEQKGDDYTSPDNRLNLVVSLCHSASVWWVLNSRRKLVLIRGEA